MPRGDPDEQPDGAARQAIERLYQENFAHVLSYALRRTSSPEDAADIAAETFAVAWRRIHEVPDREAGRLWLYGVARNVLANHRRGQLRRERLARRIAVELPASVVGPVAGARGPAAVPPGGGVGDLGAGGDAGAVGRAWTTLSDPARELLALIAWEGLSRSEAAAVLGCSRGVIRVRLHRARRQFTRALEAEEIHPGPVAPGPRPATGPRRGPAGASARGADQGFHQEELA